MIFKVPVPTRSPQMVKTRSVNVEMYRDSSLMASLLGMELPKSKKELFCRTMVRNLQNAIEEQTGIIRKPNKDELEDTANAMVAAYPAVGSVFQVIASMRRRLSNDKYYAKKKKTTPKSTPTKMTKKENNDDDDGNFI